MSEHTVTAYDDELNVMAGRIAEMGGLAEKVLQKPFPRWCPGYWHLPATIEQDRRLDELQQEVEMRDDRNHRTPAADGTGSS
jgi:phosphate transport system protein